MFSRSRVIATAGLGVFLCAPRSLVAQQHEHHPGMHQMADTAAKAAATLPGQDAFGAISEIVGILRADPKTDWSKVNIEALRQHLSDMNLVTLQSVVSTTELPRGASFKVTGDGRVGEAIRRMITAHNTTLAGQGLEGKVERVDGGVLWTVTTADSARVAEIRGLGAIGLLALGNHHVVHHLMLARGETPSGHSH